MVSDALAGQVWSKLDVEAFFLLGEYLANSVCTWRCLPNCGVAVARSDDLTGDFEQACSYVRGLCLLVHFEGSGCR